MFEVIISNKKDNINVYYKLFSFSHVRVILYV